MIGFQWAEIQNGLAQARDGKRKYAKESVKKESGMSKMQTMARREVEGNSQSEGEGDIFCNMLQNYWTQVQYISSGN